MIEDVKEQLNAINYHTATEILFIYGKNYVFLVWLAVIQVCSHQFDNPPPGNNFSADKGESNTAYIYYIQTFYQSVIYCRRNMHKKQGAGQPKYGRVEVWYFPHDSRMKTPCLSLCKKVKLLQTFFLKICTIRHTKLHLTTMKYSKSSPGQ